MHAIRPSYDAITRAVRWTVLVLAVVLAMLVVLLAVVTAPARADPGQTPDQTGPDQEQAELLLQQAITNGTATGTYVGPFGNERWVGVFGTHAAAGYGYPYPAAPDCNEGSLGAGCVGDSRGFLQGQCTSWVAYRLAMRNGLSFSNWYAGRHWGNASEWGKVAKGIGHKPDKYPAVGAIGWYKRGHVSYVEDVYSGGTILISEMNTDGHNGFHFTTVSPGMSGYPDKFIHLDDVVPVDTTPPTEPTDVRVAAHRGRSVISWRASSDTWGVAGYRVLRNGVPIGSVRGTSYRDGNPLAGQTATYSVVAYDAAGHTSSPGRVKVLPGTESADRAWLETSAGPALCGRVGTDRRHAARLPRAGRRELASGRAVPQHGVGQRLVPGVPDGHRRQRLVLPPGGPLGPLVHGLRRGYPRLGRRPHVGKHAATGRRRHLGEHAQRAGPVRTDRVRTAPHRDLLGADPDRVALGHHPRRRVVGQRGRPRVRRDPAGRDRLLPLAARRRVGPAPPAPTSTRSP